VSAGVSDAEVRAAYRRAVQRYHPDHNGGSAESAHKFEEVQEAYARIREMRAQPSAPPRSSSSDPGVDSRLAAMERELAAARAAKERAAAEQARQQARERARRAAAEATSGSEKGRASDEELGYVRTDDSFSKILADAVSGLSDRLEQAQQDVPKRVADSVQAAEQHVPKRFADLIDELESRLSGDKPKPD
jgi:curved DNA-binding protein CbpA